LAWPQLMSEGPSQLRRSFAPDLRGARAELRRCGAAAVGAISPRARPRSRCGR